MTTTREASESEALKTALVFSIAVCVFSAEPNMHDYHPLSVLVGVGGSAICLLFIVFAVITTLDLRSHLAQQRHSAAAAGVASLSVLFGLPLSTLLRGVMVATTWTSVIGVVWVVMAPFLVVDEDVDLHMQWWVGEPRYSRFSTSGQLCYACAKIGTSFYLICKAWTYVFFWGKSRSVRPMESPSRFDQAILSSTLLMFLIALINMWNIRGVASVLDGTCLFRGDPWVSITVGIIDVALSATYLWMFVAPLREIIRVNQNISGRGGGNGGTRGVAAATGGASAAATATASHDRVSSGRAMESLMRKHVISVSFSTFATVFALSWITLAHYLDSDLMAQVMWLIGGMDLAITLGPMVHLMARGSAGNNADRGRSIVGSQNSVELQHQQQQQRRRMHERMNSIQSVAPGAVTVAGAVAMAGQSPKPQHHRLGSTKQSTSKVAPAPSTPGGVGAAPGTPSLRAFPSTPTHATGGIVVSVPVSPAFTSASSRMGSAVSSDDVQPFSPTVEPRTGLLTPANVSPLMGATTPGGSNGSGGSGQAPALRYLSLPTHTQAWIEPSTVSHSEDQERKDSKD